MKLFGTSSIAGMVRMGMVGVTSLAAAAASGSPGLDVAEPENASLQLRKTVVSSKMRLVLAVGIEGTGHDYVLKVDDNLFRKNDHLSRLVGRATVKVGRYHIKRSMGTNAQHYYDTIDLGKKNMRTLAEKEAELPSPGTVMIVHGKYSYPDGHGPNKAMKYLDLRLLAEAAEAEGVDFRILYLRRAAKDILVADTMHRRFQDKLGDMDVTDAEQLFMEYTQVMITDIAVMHSFLAELDPAFVICHDFERVGEVEQSSSIAAFLAPNADLAESLKGSLIDVARSHGPSTETLPYQRADVVTARLQRKLDSFETSLCARRL